MFIYSGNTAATRAAESAARDAADAADRARSSVANLEERVERLALATEALWAIVKTRLGADDAALAEAMRVVDLGDGVLDGRARRPAVPCGACGRTVGVRHRACIYCGVPLARPLIG